MPPGCAARTRAPCASFVPGRARSRGRSWRWRRRRPRGRRPQETLGFDAGKRAPALVCHLDGAATMSQRTVEIALEAQHLAQEPVRPVQSSSPGPASSARSASNSAWASVGLPEVGARQRQTDGDTERGAVEPPSASRSAGRRARLGEGLRGGGAAPVEAGDRQLCVRQHGARLEGEGGDLPRRSASSAARSAHSRDCRDVARGPAQATVGREQERVTVAYPPGARRPRAPPRRARGITLLRYRQGGRSRAARCGT